MAVIRKRVLVLGRSGQLGKEVVRLLYLNGDKYNCIAPEESDADITVLPKIQKVIADSCPDIVVNCAAYTNVDKAEVEVSKATSVNSFGPENIAKAIRDSGAFFIHISTDYVYDGVWKRGFDDSGHLKKMTHIANFDNEKPLNAYGLSKLYGEEKIHEVLYEYDSTSYMVLRTSGVYGVYGNHFLKKVEQVLESNKEQEISLIADQIYCPTSARQLARQILALSRFDRDEISFMLEHEGNVLNASNTSWESPYTFFEKYLMARKKQYLLNRIKPISFEKYFKEHPEKARRPKEVVLENEMVVRYSMNCITDTNEALEEYVESAV